MENLGKIRTYDLLHCNKVDKIPKKKEKRLDISKVKLSRILS